jgi:hypothetical protein
MTAARRPHRALTLAAALVIAVGATACGTDDTATPGSPSSTTAPAAAHQVTILRCFDLDNDTHPAGEPSTIDTAELAAAGCTADVDSSSYDDGDLTGDLTGNVVIVPTGVDRNSVDITTNTDEAIDAIVNVPAPDCMVTADWRGQLTIAIELDDDTAAPDVTLTTSNDPC